MVITNVHILPIGCIEIEQGYILVKDGKIKEIGAMTSGFAPQDEVFDGSGSFALPGFVDAHSHLGLFGDSLGFEGEDGNEMTDPLTPQMRAIDAINCFDRGFEEALDYGVTTVLTGPGSANPISGQSAAIKTFGKCIDEMIIKAPASMKMALGENPKGVYGSKNQTPQTRMGTAAIIREELQRTQRYIEDKEKALADPELDAPEFDAKCEALTPLLKRELPVHIHAHRADDIFTAMRICKEFNLQGVIVHGTEAHLIAEYLNKANFPVICGPILGTRSKPELSGLSRSSPAVLEQHNVKFAICTDHPEMPQDTLLLSAVIAYKNGVSCQKALESITLDAAEICQIANRVGSLNAGKDADITIFKHHPLYGLEKPDAVFINGIKVR